jgi:hypothetical protein
MTHDAVRTVVRTIPPPATLPQQPSVRHAVGIHALSVLLFASGFVTYFASLLYYNSAVGVALAISLLVLGMIAHVGSALTRQSHPRHTVRIDESREDPMSTSSISQSTIQDDPTRRPNPVLPQ